MTDTPTAPTLPEAYPLGHTFTEGDETYIVVQFRDMACRKAASDFMIGICRQCPYSSVDDGVRRCFGQCGSNELRVIVHKDSVPVMSLEGWLA